jgi:hypothetical protein
VLPSKDNAILGIEIASIPFIIAGVILVSLGQPEVSKVH